MKPAKRLLAGALALLLLCSCTAPAEPEPPEPVGLSALTEDTVLFYPESSFEEKLGILIPLRDVEAAEGSFPRTHLFDAQFSSEQGAVLLRLLDYCFSEGYLGFSVAQSVLSAEALSTEQLRLLKFLYPIDGCTIRGTDRAVSEDAALPCAMFWADGAKDDMMEQFSLGLAAARDLAAECPDGLDEFGTAKWLFEAVLDRVSYGDLDTYYRKQGHQLYDALVEGVTVCTGYSDAFCYLCNLRGIDCLCVQGLCRSPKVPGTEADHQWNLARVDGAYYVFDPTWGDETPLAGAPTCFALSAQAMSMLGGHRLTGVYAKDENLPVCDACFDPASHWNDSPEGALRSYLWFAAMAEQMPIYLTAAADMIDETVMAAEADENGRMTMALSWQRFLDWAGAYMTEDCFTSRFSPPYEETEGHLTVTAFLKIGLGYEIVSVTPDAGGYSAKLQASDGTETSVFFTVEQTAGRYRIASLSWAEP